METLNKNFGIKFANFNPENIQCDDTINAVFILDVSPSMDDKLRDPATGAILPDSRISALNKGLNEFVEQMQKSHVKDRLFVSVITFNGMVMPQHGFRPILDLTPFNLSTTGGATAVFDATLVGVENAMEYREQLENTGITCKTLVFIITDGEDNMSKPGAADKVKEKLEQIMKQEKNVFSFTTILFGLGEEAEFEFAQKAMGIQHLAKVGDNIRKMINFISSSVSSSASGQQISTVTF